MPPAILHPVPTERTSPLPGGVKNNGRPGGVAVRCRTKQLIQTPNSSGCPLLQPAGPVVQPNSGPPLPCFTQLQGVVRVQEGVQGTKQVLWGGLWLATETESSNITEQLL